MIVVGHEEERDVKILCATVARTSSSEKKGVSDLPLGFFLYRESSESIFKYLNSFFQPELSMGVLGIQICNPNKVYFVENFVHRSEWSILHCYGTLRDPPVPQTPPPPPPPPPARHNENSVLSTTIRTGQVSLCGGMKKVQTKKGSFFCPSTLGHCSVAITSSIPLAHTHIQTNSFRTSENTPQAREKKGRTRRQLLQREKSSESWNCVLFFSLPIVKDDEPHHRDDDTAGRGEDSRGYHQS